MSRDEPKAGEANKEVPDGGTLFQEATTHWVENIGETEVVAIITELKG